MISQELQDSVEIIPGRLYWVARDVSGLQHVRVRSYKEERIGTRKELHNFSIDNALVYEPFHKDFGPLNLSMTCRYCRLLDSKLKDPRFVDKIIVHYCSKDLQKKANAAYLIGAYRVAVQGVSAEEAYAPFQEMEPPFLPFRDASCNIHCDFPLTILDCLCGLEKSIKLGWFNWQSFDCASYDLYEKVENGDMNWIVPGKFLAFASPYSQKTDDKGFPTMTPEDYVPILRKQGISLVIRLSRMDMYDRKRFIENGVRHFDLLFFPGTCPSHEIIKRFLWATEFEPGPVGVHCKNGLSNSPVLIGMYAMKHFQFPAKPFIAWCKICRPGSFVSRAPQQYLCEMQAEMFAEDRNLTWIPGKCELFTFVEQGSLGVKINWLNTPPKIEHVKAGSVAAAQGILEGDELMEINGFALHGSDWQEKDSFMKFIKETRPLHFKIRHKSVAMRRNSPEPLPAKQARAGHECQENMYGAAEVATTALQWLRSWM
eukprot:gnl/MRDRNA2_/MRDRNA2_79506_c0_seq1.p1 gnl/MRDRNA2_/MRDRNA2_79506_c0~~gnl/MRDRNA2_/MRDRNA2_79506_c0_seq1.p1  ORF type:complete len:485 (+),score=79.40 gnl/MRDRNA2_/MRDRNA2_79506_c0_seq1:84-1538(+)